VFFITSTVVVNYCNNFKEFQYSEIIIIIINLLPLYRVFTIMYLRRISSVHNIRAIVWLQFKVHVMSFPIINVLCFYVKT
jgi:hypothetical protein